MLRYSASTGILNTCMVYKTTLAFIIFIALSLACGKRTPPQPPVEKVQQRAEISAVQQGSQILVSASLPAQNTSATSVLNIKQVDIYRLVEKLDSPPNITEEDFAAKSTLIASLPVSSDDFASRRVTYRDVLEFSGQAARLRYAVRFVNASGQKAAFSNFLLIEPTSRVAARPELKTTEVSQEQIRLGWDAPAVNVDGSQPANILGYNVYRIDPTNPDGKILNASPVTQTFFGDVFFEFEKTYKYFVRAVSVGSAGQPIESESSNQLEVTTKDTFPPAAPESVTIAATPNSISIFFAANTEKDVVGYRVYRATDRSLPPAEWLNLTPELLQTNTLQDMRVEAGKTYFYFVTAVDKFGNTSRASEIVSETIP